MFRKGILAILLGALITVMSACGDNGVQLENSFYTDIQIAYRTLYEDTYSENNVFYVNEDVYIKILLKDLECVTCGKSTQKEMNVIVTFRDLEELSEPTLVGGSKLEPLAGSETGVKSYQITLSASSTPTSNIYAIFHMRGVTEKTSSFTVEVLENDDLDRVGYLDVRTTDE